jgi:uncharacterized protein (DUF983 family)
MMPDHGKIEELTDNIKSYLNTNFDLIKYQAVERATVIMADTVTYVVIGLFLLMFLFFISLWACFYLSSLSVTIIQALQLLQVFTCYWVFSCFWYGRKWS